MRAGLLLFALLPVLVGSSGCMRQRVNQQLLERELRVQEDCIWQLKWALEDAQNAAEEARQQAETYKKEADALRDQTGMPPDLSPPATILGPTTRDSEAPRLPPAPGVGPLIEPGTEIAPPTIPPAPDRFSPPGDAPPSGAGGSSSTDRTETPRHLPERNETIGPALTQATALAPSSRALRNGEAGRPAERLNPNAEIDRIVLDERLCGGLDLDDQPGDELLSVAISLRDADGKAILAPGDVSIAVVDPAIEGPASRIARWDFIDDEVAKHVRRNRESASLQFELPWQKMPQHGDLRLFVRFTTYDGRRLEANLPIEVQLAHRGWKKSTVADTRHDDNTIASRDDHRIASRGAATLPAEPSEPGATTDDPQSRDTPRPKRAEWSPDR